MTSSGEVAVPGADGSRLAAGDPRAMQSYLGRKRWLADGEIVEGVERAGQGNMNLVLRVRTSRRSIIVKQGRPFVERFPDIAAPSGRTSTEAEWYGLAGRLPELAARMPRLIAVDHVDQVIVLSDLGVAADYTGIYAGESLDDTTLDALAAWLVFLHGTFRDDPAARKIDNREMRLLNHEHIFEVPFLDPGPVDLEALTPGLSGLAATLRADRRLRTATAELGHAYLGAGSTLLHGDYHPGSWLRAPGGPHVIDPEFGFFGLPELDVGFMLAHLLLARAPTAVDRMLSGYLTGATLDVALAWGFAGVEVIRRLLGVSQLPRLAIDLEAKGQLLDAAAGWVRAAG